MVVIGGSAPAAAACGRISDQIVDRCLSPAEADGVWKGPAEDNALVEAFLKDDRYLVTSPNAYNSLGVGATQLYNETVVYNHKRHGNFTLGGREFEFRKKPAFPKTLTKEFLLVDLVNNLDHLAEDREQLLARVKEQALQGNRSALTRAAKEYGMVRTRKFFNGLTADRHAG
jgi:hypothetical protein